MACGALPNVKYTVLPPTKGSDFGIADEEGLMRYALPSSTLILDYKKDKDGDDETDTVVLTAVPSESPVTMAVALDDQWGRKTTLQWTKIPNTELLATVGTEVTDNREKVVKAVGEAITGIIGLREYQLLSHQSVLGIPLPELGSPEPKPTEAEPFPVALDPFAVELDKYNEITLRRSGMSITLRVTFGEQQPGSAQFENFNAKPTRHVLITSACRNVTIKILKGSRFAGQEFTAKVADASAYQTVPLPQKGMVKLHPVCGADVIASPSTAVSDIEITAAAVAQAKAIAQAWNPKPK
jgi:hypothetical protein